MAAYLADRGPAQAALHRVRRDLPPGATAQVFSARTGAGLDDLIACLGDWYALPATG